MAQIIGVRFQAEGKMYFFDAGEAEINSGEYVIVETVKGIEFAEVVMGKRFMNDEDLKAPLKPVIRKATAQDIAHAVDNRNHEKEAFSICQKKIGEHKLEMKLVGAEAAFDNSKLTFYFTANGRVDFRSLVKDLASVFKTRIELRQIGVRDEAKMIGGLGPCGRQICCGAFLVDFEPVSIKMAKEQNLSLNPTKISGVCGRLMCCLKYEEEDYECTRKRMPKIGKEVITPDGNGTVTDLNIVKETVKVRIAKGDSFEINEYELDKIARPGVQTQEADVQTNTGSDNENEDAYPLCEIPPETGTEDLAGNMKADGQEATEIKEDPYIVEKGQNENREENAQSESKKAERKYGTQQRHTLGQPVFREKKGRTPNRNTNREANNEAQKNESRTGKDNRGGSGMNHENRKNNHPDTHGNFKTDKTNAAVPAGQPQTGSTENVKPKNNWAADLERALAAAENSNKG